MSNREEYLEAARNAKPKIINNGTFGTFYKLMFDKKFLQKQLTPVSDIRTEANRTIHPRGYWANCTFTTDGHYNIPTQCEGLVRFSYGTSSNAIGALSIKLFYGDKHYDIITNNFNLNNNLDFHSAFRTNVYFKNAPLMTLIVSQILIRAFSETKFDPNVFDVQHLALDDKSGTPETLFFKYGGSATLFNQIKKGDILDIHSGDGICIGRKIGQITIDEDVYQDLQLDHTIAFKHYLRPLGRKPSRVPKVIGYLYDIINTPIDHYLNLDGKMSSLYNELYLFIKPKDPDVKEPFPSDKQELPLGLENIDSDIKVHIPTGTSRFKRKIILRFMKIFNSIRFIKSDLAVNSDKSQVTVNYLIGKQTVEKFLLNGPGICTLSPYNDDEWIADLDYYNEYNVRKEYQPYGCCIFTDGKEITGIKINDKLLPPDDLYALRVAYATLIMHITMTQHLSLDHLVLANNLALYTEKTFDGDFFSKFGKLTSFGTFDINYNGAPVLILPGGVFDRLFAFDHVNMINALKNAKLKDGIYTPKKLDSLPPTQLVLSLRKMFYGPYMKLASIIVEKSPHRDWSLFLNDQIKELCESDDIVVILAIHLLHVSVDHYLVGRLEPYVSTQGFRSTIPKMGNIDVSHQEFGLIDLTLKLTFHESLDMANGMEPYFMNNEMISIWKEFTHEVNIIAAEANICGEQIATSIDI